MHAAHDSAPQGGRCLGSQQAALNWQPTSTHNCSETSSRAVSAQTVCSDAWHCGSIADPTLWLGGGMPPNYQLITQVTWSPGFYDQAQYYPLFHRAC